MVQYTQNEICHGATFVSFVCLLSCVVLMSDRKVCQWAGIPLGVGGVTVRLIPSTPALNAL